jgi:hypothetical protein
MKKRPKKSPDVTAVPLHDWRTTDADEINRRRQRAETGSFAIRNLNPEHPVFSNFIVDSPSGRAYSVEIRGLKERQFSCECVDFCSSNLGTCKHVEAVLLHLGARKKREFIEAQLNGPQRADVTPDSSHGTLRISGRLGVMPRSLRELFDADGILRNGSPEEALVKLRKAEPERVRVSQEVEPWLEASRRLAERKALRHEYEQKVQRGEWPPEETLAPLFPYQREGMLHLAFTERALLADEMGLGKTIQAIAACALLHRLGKAQRVLVVTPASLKSEWEEQIQRFTLLPYQIVYGGRLARLPHYHDQAPFFTIVNYEQMVKDSLDVNKRLCPDVVVLDEAQRIKNWSTKTSQAIKRLRSRYAFVLTGTPIENRIDELHSLMDFLDPSILGPLFRFNRDFYQLDERGKPEGYCNLDRLHERVSPFLLRRRKAQVETELPDRTDLNRFVAMSPQQIDTYQSHEAQVSRLVNIARRRPLTQQESDKLMRELAMMRMICDTNYILDQTERTCPKLAELESILEECRENAAVKVIIFSEWEKMLELVRDLCRQLKLGFAWHTGSVPQKRRRGEINSFKMDPACRVFLSTDAGATGLNLQNASVVINCDLPWNPAKLEQRIARAWRKNQTRPVTVINLISEKSIESRMLETLADKKALAGGVLDREGDLKEIKLRSGREAMLARLEQVLSAAQPPNAVQPTRVLPVDRQKGFAEETARVLNGAFVRCEERFPKDAPHSVMYVVVEREAAQYRGRLETLHQEYFGEQDPLAPVHLEVIERSAHEALERLIASGLVSLTTRGNRVLFPVSQEAAPAPLTPEQLSEIAALRKQAERKVKMATILGEGDFAEDARPPLLEAIMLRGRALAIESRFDPPRDVEEALRLPFSGSWKSALQPLRDYIALPDADWRSVAEELNRIC